MDTTFELSDDGSKVTFTTKRKLDTGDTENDYLIPMSKEIDMIWALRTSTGSWKEHNKYGKFKVTFDESYGNIDVPFGMIKIAKDATGIETLDCFKKSWNDFTLDSCLDADTKELVFRVDMPNNSWFAIGFGKNMSNTDMIAWFADNGRGQARDYYSTSHSTPELDDVSNLTLGMMPRYNSSTDRMVFLTRRKLDTGDEK